MRRSRQVLPIAIALALVGCRQPTADAYGNFEAVEVTVAAEASGRLLRLTAEEGATLTAGDEVGLVDTVAQALQRDEVRARRAAASARSREVDANAAALESQRMIADRELDRTRRLASAQAATSQQLDRAEREASVLRDQIEGARAARQTIVREVATLDAQMATIDDRVRRSRITAPMTGTVIARYVEPGEYVQTGTPLFKMAALDTLVLRAFLSGAQVSQVAIGDALTVRVDAGRDSLRTVEGRVTWVSPVAEFTPTPIQTREERTTQVYAIKIAVPNVDGRLRIGMPGEVTLVARDVAR